MKGIWMICFWSLWILTGCSDHQGAPLLKNSLGIIPAPRQADTDFNPSKVVSLEIYLPDSLMSGHLRQMLKAVPQSAWVTSDKANVQVTLDTALAPEEYNLEILSDNVIIRAGGKPAVQYALTSLGQVAKHRGYPLPICRINDSPRFKYRGMHLDVGRHFFSVEDVKKYLDYMATYKYNHFHWHLTEDQGWRIEIKKYPKLQEVAAFRKETLIGHYNDQPHKFDGKKYGGFYTQEEVRDIVSYATERNITVVPEIEMPGHSLAALAAYPELGCRLDRSKGPQGSATAGGEVPEQPPYEVATKWGVFEDVYCPTEFTFSFLEDVLDEVMTLFPGKYIHIGGDECPKEAWKNSLFCQNLIREKNLKNEEGLQSYFISRMEQYINAHGRQIIGWDEILEGGLAPNATVMSWRGIEGGLAAAREDHDVIMTPGTHCYFDHYQSASPDEPLAIGGLTTLEKVYHWEPVPAELEAGKTKFIIGGQANVWTEYIPDFSKVEYMAFARGMAMAEALWGNNADYDDFLNRFLVHSRYWNKKGANVANHVYDLHPVVSGGNGHPVKVSFSVPKGTSITVEKNGNRTGSISSGEPFTLAGSGKYSFKVNKKDIPDRPCLIEANAHLGTGATLTLDSLPAAKYSGLGAASLNNGITGPVNKFSHPEWLGWQGPDASGVYDFGKEQKLTKVTFRFYHEPGSWIYSPSGVRILLSNDRSVWQEAANISMRNTASRIQPVEVALSEAKARYMKFIVKNAGAIPAGNPGAGEKSWLFIDEIIIN